MAQLRVGDNVSLRAKVFLGDLRPEDVHVEIVLGKVTDNEELYHLQRVEMTPRGQEDGAALYQGDFQVDESGQFAYGVRVFPYHPALPHPFDLALVKWA